MPGILGRFVENVAKPRRIARFENFEFDLRSGELRRKGAKSIQLPDQPFRILAMLLELPGDLVTREEIRDKLWPNGTVVEFEHSISAAMNRLRQALGDSTDNPRYIETLARRGYRWKAPVQWVEFSPAATPDRNGVEERTVGGALIGKKVSHYRVLEVLGGGGMGVVYKAEDLRLGRRVALKFLPEELASHPDALQRFEREARAASALSHPNICTIFEIDDHEQQPFIVMELLEGETLREVIAPGTARGSALSLEKLLDLSIQIAQGLDAAHRGGIVHRDVKPANIFVTTSGQVKILDFGLAKISGGISGDGTREPDCENDTGQAQRKTESFGPELLLSRAGVAMGTAGYMSPEQVRGEKLDERTDLFSFGLILYEMATGRRAFIGETSSELHDAILHRTPTAARYLNPEIPARVEQIINRALAKDLNLRYPSAGAMLSDLKAGIGSAESVGGTASVASESSAHISRSWKRWSVIAAGFALLVGAAAISVRGYLRYREASRLTDQDTVILADFTNSTGNPIFDLTVRGGFDLALRQSPFLNILAGGKVGATLRLMGQPANTPLVAKVATEVCRRAGSRGYITGSINSRGSAYAVNVKVVNCQTGKVMAHEQADAVSRDRVLDAVSDSAGKLRLDLGESQASVWEFGVPLKQAATPSLEALQAYILGMRAGDEKGETARLPYELHAIQLDPNFALAYLTAGEDCMNGACPAEKAMEYLGRAFELQDRATLPQKLQIESTYYVGVTGELDKVAEIYQKHLAIYPRSSLNAYTNLSIVYSELGRYEKAAEMARQAIPLNPEEGRLYGNLAHCFLALQRFGEARDTLQAALARKPDSDSNHEDLYALAFLTHDSQGLAEQAAWLKQQPEYEHLAFSLESDTAAYAGHVRRARELTRQAVEAAIHIDKEVAGMWSVNAALREAAFGNVTEARQAADQALKLAPASESVELEAALALAMAGEAAQSESLAQDLNKRFPLDTQVQSLWLPTIDAQLALNKKNPAAAIDRLQAAAPIELGFVPFTINISCIYPVYVRGLANLAAGDGQAAANEFQKVLDHSGIVQNCGTGALSYLGLARANALEAHTQRGPAADAARARSLAAYRDFLALWQNADAEIPILREAKAEYAKLL